MRGVSTLQARSAVKVQKMFRARSSRLYVGELRLEAAEQKAASTLTHFFANHLPRRRLVRLRRATRLIQAGVRVMLLRWEVLGVRGLRRDFHRRVLSHPAC